MGPRAWKYVQKVRREKGERGAEMVEFAFVVVLLIMLLYGIITYGLILAAQATITQAAADGARAGIVASSTYSSTAIAQVTNDVGWMGKGACNAGASPNITCTATKAPCPSNTNANCITVTVTYNYASSPLFPELPGLGVITPHNISSTTVLQMS